MFERVTVACLLSFTGIYPACADCGSIPFQPNVKIFEPTQRALIAFNGRKQILVLSTDLRASKPTKVLEVMPFRSEPTVSKGDLDSFVRATDLINIKRLQDSVAGAFGGAVGQDRKAKDPSPPPAMVTFQKRIGAHDVSVVNVITPSRFTTWVDDFLRRKGVEQPQIPASLQQVIREYLADRFRWFVFNVVELGTSTVTKDAVQYEFATRRLYYPLRITRAETGATKVRLLLITRGLVAIPDLRPAKVQVLHTPVRISGPELESIHLGMHTLMPRGGMLRIWSIDGELSAFKRDLVTR